MIISFILIWVISPISSKKLHGQSPALDSLEREILIEKDNSRKINLILSKGNLLLVTDPASAREADFEALKLAAATKSAFDSATIITQIARSYYAQGEFGDAAKYQSKVLALSKSFPDSVSFTAKSINALAIFLKSQGQKDTALTLLNKALLMHTQEGDSLAMVNVLSNIAITHNDMGHYEEATEKYEEVKDLYQRLGYKEGVGLTYNNMATLAIEQGNHLVGIQNLLRALAIFEDLGDKYSQLLLLSNISYLYELNEQHKEVKHYNAKALALADELGNKVIKAKALASMGRLAVEEVELKYKKFNDLSLVRNSAKVKEGIALIRESIVIFKSVQDPEGEGNSILYLADAFRTLGEKDSALILGLQAKAIWEKHGLTSGIGIAESRLCHFYTEKGQYQKAIEAGENALRIASEVNSKQTERDAHGELSGAYAKIGDFEKAFFHKSQNKVLHDSLYDAQKTMELARVQFEADEKEKEEARENALKLEREQKKTQEQRQRLITLGVVAALLITGIIALSLQQRKVFVQKVNTELEAQKEVLEDRNRDLNELNQVKDKIFSIISHDLRSPLTTLINLIEVSSEADFTQEEMQLYLNELGHQAKHTAGTLDNLLFWLQGQRNSISIRPAELSLNREVAELVQLFSLTARQKNIELINDIPRDASVYADANSVKLILRNLISNAIKFSTKGRSIEVFSKENKSENMLNIYVRDYGVGMSEERRHNLFDVSGLSKRGTFNEHGVGLGLVLVKEFVDKNGGSIQVESEPGEGSTFIVSLPIVKALKPAG
ncbi:MAG: tetratricopeptide repeat protein [Bacteroidia bacterium]